MTNKVMTWVLIMTLLISQSYAYASIPCESNRDATSQHISELDSMVHSLLETDMTNQMQHDMPQQDVAMECCDHDCSCPTGVCASAMLTHFFHATPLKLVSEPSGFYLFSKQDVFLPSLRKPPIIG
jgi:hypothetical protein